MKSLKVADREPDKTRQKSPFWCLSQFVPPNNHCLNPHSTLPTPLQRTTNQIHKYTHKNKQIHKYKNTQIHKYTKTEHKLPAYHAKLAPSLHCHPLIFLYTNTQIHKYTNTQIDKNIESSCSPPLSMMQSAKCAQSPYIPCMDSQSTSFKFSGIQSLYHVMLQFDTIIISMCYSVIQSSYYCITILKRTRKATALNLVEYNHCIIALCYNLVQSLHHCITM